MSADSFLEPLSLLQVLLYVGVLGILLYRRLAGTFPALILLVVVAALGSSVHTAILYFRHQLHLPVQGAYHLLFISGWIAQLSELFLLVLIMYGLFTEAMRPFPGLQRIGQIVFRWVGSVSLLVALALSAGPELFARGTTLLGLYSEIAPRFQQGMNVLVLCLLIFVCFSIRPLGLTFRSHIFGVALGLAIFSTTQLVQAAWLAIAGNHSLYSPVYSFEAFGNCVAGLIWVTYFALPEPRRRMILLPTTSPFFLWNHISEVLGDAPGNVAVAGFSPSMLAPAEIEMLTIAISREDAMARERQEMPVGNGRSTGLASLPLPSERDFALSR